MAEKIEDKKIEKIPELKSGMTVRVHQKIKEEARGTKGKKDKDKEEKERIQIFEGMILAYKKGKKPFPTITVRKIASGGIGVEKIFPVGAPTVVKIEPIKQARVRRSRLYYLRSHKKKLKEKKIV